MMTWLVAGLALLLVALALTLPGAVAGQWTDLWRALAPNLFAEILGLAIALAIAEVLIRVHRTRRGVAQIAPILFKLLTPAMQFDLALIEGLDYTPKEFKAIHKDYLDGHMNPIHIPHDFKARLLKSCAALDGSIVERAIASLDEAEDFVAKFAGVLEPAHVMLLHVSRSNLQKFQTELARTPREDTDLAEAYLDAHDSLVDVNNAFSFPAMMRRAARALA